MVRIEQDKNDIYIDFTHNPGDQGKFIFLVVGKDIFYLDTSIGKLWRTDIMFENLGEEHKEALAKFIGLTK